MKLFVINFAELELWYISNIPLYKLDQSWIAIPVYDDHDYSERLFRIYRNIAETWYIEVWEDIAYVGYLLPWGVVGFAALLKYVFQYRFDITVTS